MPPNSNPSDLAAGFVTFMFVAGVHTSKLHSFCPGCRFRDICVEAAKEDVPVSVWAVRLDPYDPAGGLHPFQLLCQQHIRRPHLVPAAVLLSHHQ